MNEVYEDPLARLEAVLLEWDQSFTESRRQVTSRLQNAKERLELAWCRAETAKEATARAVAGAVCAAENQSERIMLAEALEKANAQIAALENSLERSYEQVRNLEDDRKDLLLRNDELNAAKAELSAHNVELKAQIDTMERTIRDLQDQLEAARRAPAAESLESHVDPLFTAVASPYAENAAETHSLSQRLAEALRDRDEAHQQIVQLRAEIEQLRFSDRNAFLNEPANFALPAFDGTDPSFTRLRLGQMLQRNGIVTEAQLATALEAKKKTPQKPLGAILVDLGFTDWTTIGKVLASQLNLPFIELDQRAIDPAAAALIPAKLARHHICIPISVERGQLLVAMANPLDLIALEDLEIATRRRVDPVIATPPAINAAIAQHYTAI